MCKKSISIVAFAFVLGLVPTSVATAADPNLVGWWKLDETSGTIAHDSSGNGHDGILMGTPQWVPGQIGGALELDGVDDYVETIGYKGIIGNQARTVTAWIKTSGVGGRLAIISWGDKDNNGGKAWTLALDGGNLRVEVWGGYTRATTNLEDGNWHHVAAVLANDGSPNLSEVQFFVDGNADTISAPGDRSINTESECDLTIGSQIAVNQLTNKHRFFPGLLDDVQLYNRALTGEEIQEVMKGVSPSSAFNPSPANEATDVPREVVLSWEPGEFAAPTNGHKVYFGESFDDVNNATGVAQTAASYAPAQRLDFGKTYYWRVDEVNAPPTSHVEFKGEVWSFTTEPIGYPIPAEKITGTASSSNSATEGPENTVNGSGLDADDLHSTELTDMWLSGSEPLGAWIQYEFDKAYKLHQMWVWNSNKPVEPLIGFGLKDVMIEYSVNGTDWIELGGVPEFAQAPGAAGYAHNTTVDFGGAAAKYVKITANSNWGGLLPQYGLSEVRFFYIPVQAREPDPESGTTDVSIGTIDEPIDVSLGFRAGREAVKHDVYLSSDEQAVIDGTAPATTVTEPGYGPLSLDVGKTYYWRVDEVNEAESPATWPGDIWNFTTQQYFVVDDFEDYNDYPPDEIFSTWIDGWGIPTNGALAAHAEAPFAETTIVHGGKQSMPFYYDNTAGATYSEAELALSPAQDWSKSGIQTLSLWFYGDPNNSVTEQMYVKLNGFKVAYDGDAADIKQASWKQWTIDLASLGVDLRNVTKLVIGFGDETNLTPGGSGVMYFDDIRLYPLREPEADLAGN